MVIALGTNLQVSLDHLSIDDLVAGVTFNPEFVRKLQFLPSLTFFLLFS